MSNTSYPFKENSIVMNVQGGEKKVMKKILTVALSTAMAFSMFASVAFGDTAVTPQQKFDALAAKGIFNGYPDGSAHLEKEMTRAEFAKVITKLLGLKEVTGTLSYKDKGYDAKNWAVPYIEAVTAAGIMQGQDNVKKIFNYNGKVTIQEMATVLTRALKLEIPANPDNNAADWAKGYVQAAIDKGLISKDANFKANASRSQLVEAAYAIDQAANITFTYKVVDPSNVEFTLSTGEVVNVKLDTPLVANKETEVKFKDKAGNEYTGKVTWVVTNATKVQSAASTNLKEVDVAFDGKVDKASATDKDNYSINSGAKVVKSAALLEDGKTVRLLLADGYTFVQGTEYTVSVKNVKSDGKVLSTQDVKFTSADNTLPTVSEVKALGNKAIKVTFSEPVKNVASSNFQLDDKAFVGSVTKGANEREVILKDYTGNYAVGAHKITSSLVEDYAGLKSLSSTNEFSVVEDKEGPVVSEISATLEKVTVTFNEEVDPASVTSDSFYWKSGDTKKTGKATQIAGNVYEVDFTANPLPGYETTLYINVKDYSGNANATVEHKITASVDLTRPKVSSVEYGKDGNNILTVKFDKAVYGDVKGAYKITKGDNTYPVTNAEAAPGSDNKVFYLTTSSGLGDGEYTLKISGIKDRTVLGNTMEDYSTTFKVDDVTRPSLNKDIDASNLTRTIVVNFDKKMDLASITNRGNYYLDLNLNGNNVTKSLPAEVSIRPILEGRAVQLVFPEYVDGNVPTSFGEGSNTPSVKAVTVVGVKSAAGNILNTTYAPKPITVKDATPEKAVQKDYRTIEVTFDQAISQAYASDFTVSGASISSVSIADSGDVVVIKTASDLSASGSDVIVKGNSNLRTYAGNKVTGKTLSTTSTVAPKLVNGPIYREGNKITVPFTTTLKTENANLFGFDLTIKQADIKDTPALVAGVDYSTEWSKTGVIVNLDSTKAQSYTGSYTLQVNDGAKYIAALNGETAVKSDPVVVTNASTTAPDAVAITAVSATDAGSDAVPAKAELSLAGKKVALTAKTAGAAYNNYVVVVSNDSTDVDTGKAVASINDKVITVKGNATTVKAVADALNANESITKLFTVTTDDVAPGTALTVGGNTTTATGVDAVAPTVTLTANSKVTKFNYVALYTSNNKSGTPVIVSKDKVSVSANGLTLVVELPAGTTTTFQSAELL